MTEEEEGLQFAVQPNLTSSVAPPQAEEAAKAELTSTEATTNQNGKEKGGEDGGEEEEAGEDEDEDVVVASASYVEGNAVRFQLVSDIHLEFPGCEERLPPIPVRSPVLALLGTHTTCFDFVYIICYLACSHDSFPSCR